jgi:anti-sigma factor RsiW
MSNLSDKEREDLVAYLDGELDAKRARAVEAKIGVDERFRAEADALKQAWDLLEHLPRAEPSAGFTHRTLERLAFRPARGTGPVPATRWPRWALPVGWAAAALLAAAVGYAAGGWLAPREPPPAPVQDEAEVEDTLVRHLRVIQNRHLYELADDFGTLQALDDPDLFGDDSGS